MVQQHSQIGPPHARLLAEVAVTPKLTQVQLRWTEEEEAALKRMAERDSRKVAHQVLHLIRTALREAGLLHDHKQKDKTDAA